MWMKLSILCVIYLAVSAVARSLQKRVIGGWELRSRTDVTYKSPKYFIWIGFARAVSQKKLQHSWKFDREACGGALLTHKIGQTACHCFCDFQSPTGDGIRWHVRKDRKFEAVAGLNVVDETQPVSVNNIVTHPYCAYMPYVHRAMRYDTALFELNGSFQESNVIAFAPPLRIIEMAKMWTRFVRNRAVCLLIGFGRYITTEDITKPEVLRHGWLMLESYFDCFTKNTNTPDFKLFQESSTFSCLRPFGKYNISTGKGDSGSPISCNNQYFSMVSTTDTCEDLIYNIYANSIELRGSMVREMLDQLVTFQGFIPKRMSPGPLPANFFGLAKSNGRPQFVIYFSLDLIVSFLVLIP